MIAQQAASSGNDASQFSGRLVLAHAWIVPAVMALSLFWTVVFAFQAQWILASSQAVVFVVCILSLLLARRGQLGTAMLLTQCIFVCSVALLCLLFDVPNASVPRVSHIFLLVVAMVGYLNFKRQPSGAQLLLVGLCILGFIAFSSSSYVLPFAYPISDDIRIYGAWVNSVIATLMLVACIYLFQLELQKPDQREAALRNAIWQRQFELFYQPQVDRDGRVTGAEALLRWKHPRRGYVSPGEFIPLAEQTGLMNEIGAWVLETACQTLASWQLSGETRHLTLSVNVSASQFHDEDFEQIVMQLLDRFDLDPTRLKLEVTESVMMGNIDAVASKMQILRGIGIGLALDDFGTGYSSLSYIRRLPLSQLKIDRSFVQDVIESERSAALARSIVQLGCDLELSVLAEGIETPEQFAFLRGSGCEEFQGFYFGRPVPLNEFGASLLRAAA